MWDKEQIRAIFLLEFKMGHKASETTHNINNAFGLGTANECTVQWCSRSFAEETRWGEDGEHRSWPLEVDSDQLRGCWSWSSNTLATWCKELTHWKRPWCGERLREGEEGDNRGWDGWLASQTQWTWVWVNSVSWWCHPTISSSVIPFSSCLQSFPASGYFQINQLFSSGGQNIGVSASTSVLPANTQDWFPLGGTGWISLQSKGLSRVFSNSTVQKHQFLGAQLSL